MDNMGYNWKGTYIKQQEAKFQLGRVKFLPLRA